MIKYLCVVLFMMVLIWGCSSGYDDSDHPRVTSAPHTEPSVGITENNYEATALKNKISAVNLHNTLNIGEFFDHRLQFFKLSHPALKIGHSPVDEVIFYFIDSALVKLRYKVKGNVSDYLFDSLGVSKFKPLDDLSKALAADGHVVDRYGGRYVINKSLKNYELVWRKNNTVSRFRVSSYEPDSSTLCYFYHELNGYATKIRELESMYYALDDSVIPD